MACFSRSWLIHFLLLDLLSICFRTVTFVLYLEKLSILLKRKQIQNSTFHLNLSPRSLELELLAQLHSLFDNIARPQSQNLQLHRSVDVYCKQHAVYKNV